MKWVKNQMKNKVLVELVVPEIDEIYNVYIPINRRVGNVISLISKAIFELTNGEYQNSPRRFIYSSTSGIRYDIEYLIRDTDIRNGSRIILI